MPIKPRLGPKIVERVIPQNKKIKKMAGIFFVKTKQNIAGAQMIVPIISGIFNPNLSASHPPALSPITMPIIDTENINPIVAGETPIELR